MRRREEASRLKGITVTIILVMIIGSVVWASKSYPGYKVNAYVDAINQGKFDKAYELVYKDEYFNIVSKEEYIHFLDTYFNKSQFVRLEKGKQLEYGQAYNVRYVFKDKAFDEVLGVVNHQNQWYIQNPFSIQAIVPNKIKPVEEVGVNVFPVEKKVIEVKKEPEALDTFISRFYKDYITGIKNKDKHFLASYVIEGNLTEITEEYADWYINNKDVQDIKMRIEVESIDDTNADDIIMELIEIAELTNLEKLDGQEVLKPYKVVTIWEVHLRFLEDSYQITQKHLQESVISYQDNNKQWIAY